VSQQMIGGIPGAVLGQKGFRHKRLRPRLGIGRRPTHSRRSAKTMVAGRTVVSMERESSSALEQAQFGEDGTVHFLKLHRRSGPVGRWTPRMWASHFPG